MTIENQDFFQRVYAVVRQIPYGRVTTYGAIASYLGSKKSARMVGWALNSKRYTLGDLPAHRVVNKQGMLTGKKSFGGMYVMQELLENEGIVVKDDRIVEFEKFFWDPAEAL